MILPEQGNFITLSVKKEILDKIQITQEEIKECEIVEKDGQITWENTKETEIEFSEVETELIKKQLKELDEKGTLKDASFSLYKLFI